METSRRRVLTGLISLVAAPAIVGVHSKIMRVNPKLFDGYVGQYDGLRFVTAGPDGPIERMRIDANGDLWLRCDGQMIPAGLPLNDLIGANFGKDGERVVPDLRSRAIIKELDCTLIQTPARGMEHWIKADGPGPSPVGLVTQNYAPIVRFTPSSEPHI